MGSYNWKYKQLDGVTYHILRQTEIAQYLDEFILKEWQADHDEQLDPPRLVDAEAYFQLS